MIRQRDARSPRRTKLQAATMPVQLYELTSRESRWHDCVGACKAAWAGQSHRHHRRNRGCNVGVNKLVEKDGGGPPITRSLTMEKLFDKETN